MSLRTKVYDLLKVDSTLAGYDITEATLYPTFSVDSPTARRFVVLRWSGTDRGIGGVNTVTLSIWAYDRERDYAAIDEILKRCRAILTGLEGASLGGGWGVGVEWAGGSDDLEDDVYGAVTRFETYRITASGT